MTQERGNRGGQGQGRGEGAGQPRVGGSVRVRGEDGTDKVGTISAVNGDGTVNIDLEDGTPLTNVRKGGRVGGWRPPEDEEEETGGTV